MIPEPSEFNRALRRWFRGHGRDLPWRSNPTPYGVMVSEFMLQQTTVAAVKPYFDRWMLRFPDVASLASAKESDVLKLWEGLGYYSRARNLQRAAQAVVARHAGQIPSDIILLRELPGVGPYTAAAIAAFAFDQSVSVLDANINRVMARLFNYQKNITTSEGRRFLEQAAASLLPTKGGRLHASALMDLGSLICRAGQPDCSVCPVKKFCRAEAPATLPVKPPKKEITLQTDWRIFAQKDGHVYLMQSPGPTWKGLWVLPPGKESLNPLTTLSYAITRYKVSLGVVSGEPEASWQPFPINHLPAMPSPHRKALSCCLKIFEATGT
jgi:A/G-specific adenine glycosylase